MPDDKVEKEEKPKKAFLIKTVIWEDGTVDTDIREYRKLGSGRGAPTLCGPLDCNDLKKAIKGYGLNPDGVLSAVAVDFGIEEESDTVENELKG